LSGLIVLGFLVDTGNGFAQKQSFRYTARLAAPVLQPGEFKAPKLVWSCKGDVCETRSSVAVPTVGQCRELAKLVGRVKSFGNEKKSLGSSGLEACAKGIQIANRAPLPGLKALPPFLQLPPSIFSDTGSPASGGDSKKGSKGVGKDRIAGTADDEAPGSGFPPASQLPYEEPRDETPAYSSEEDELPHSSSDETPAEETSPASGTSGTIRTAALVLEGSLESTVAAFVPVRISTPALVLQGEWIFGPLTIPTEALVLEGEP
jgi:hypothetical protein